MCPTFDMPSTFQQTFRHLVVANNVLNDGSTLPPLHPAPHHPDARPPTDSAPSSNPPAMVAPVDSTPAVSAPSSPTETDVKIIQGRTYNSQNLLHAGYRYSKDGAPLKDGRQSWRCVKRNPERCTGRLYTVNDNFRCLGKSHNHPPSAVDSNVKAAISNMKQMAMSSQSSNHRIYCAVTGTLPTSTLSHLPQEGALKKAAQRARKKMNPRPRAPVSLADLVLTDEDCRTLRGVDMLLYDNGSDERRVVMLATAGNLTTLAESSSWYLDGTFKSAPIHFYQLLIIHAELNVVGGGPWCIPTIYVLLTHKDTAIYLEAFQVLVSNCPHLDPQVLMADFELALRSALSSVFPAALLDACFFHYCQAILDNVNKLGYKTEYEAVTTDRATGTLVHSEFHTWVRRLMMLAMVPPSDVPAAFETIVDNVPERLQMDPLLAYFERTWIAGLNGRQARYPPPSWNQVGRIESDLNRTNNNCESFNKTFTSVVGHAHPTIYNFLSAVQLEQASSEGKIESYK